MLDSLSCFSHRDSCFWGGCVVLLDSSVDVVPNLLSQVLANLFVRHEFSLVADEVAAESQAALADPATVVFDALHRTAFRGGLANSVFASPQYAKKVTRAQVTEYLASVVGPDSLAVVGAGVDHEDLLSLVDAVMRGADLPANPAPKAPSSYHGGETRIEAPGASRYVLATEGLALGSAERPALLVLQGILGSGEARVKYGNAGAAPFAALSNAGVTVSPVSASYSDAGLFGISVVAKDAKDVKAAVEGAVAALKKAASGVSAQELERGKKAAVTGLEAGREGVLAAATEVLSGGFETPAELAQKISGVTAEQVSQVRFF